MAEITKQALKVDNNQSFPNNNNGAITPSILRAFNTNMIDSLVDEIGYTADSSSWNQQIDALEQFTASASGLTTGSLLVTASAVSNVITFTKGNGSTFNVTVADTTDLSSLNAFTASATISLNNLNLWTSSYQPVIVNLQASQSIDNTKFNNIGTQSGSWDNTSLNSYTASNDTKWNTLGGQSGSWVTESETGSFARTDASNTFTQTNIFTSISASSFISASEFVGNGSKITGITASISLPILDEGIPQGNAFSMNFTGSAISAIVVGGTAVVSVNAISTASLNTLTQSFNDYTASTDAKFVAVGASTSSLNSFTASQDTKNSTLASVTASLQQQLTNIGGQSGSWITESESGSFLITASFDNGTRNLTFTKGNTTQFSVNIPDASGSAGDFVTTSSFNAYTSSNDQKVNSLISATGSYATTGSNTFNGVQTIRAATGTPLIVDHNDASPTQNTLIGIFKSGSAEWSIGNLGTDDSFVVYNPNTFQIPISIAQNNNVTLLGGISASFVSASTINGLGDPLAFSTSVDSRLDGLEASTSSYVTSAITASSLVTASFSGNTLTFTKGDTSTFGVVIPDVSGSTINTGSFATTGSNTFYGDQIISGNVLPLVNGQGDLGSDTFKWNSVTVNGQLKGSSINTTGRGLVGTLRLSDESFPLSFLADREIVGDGTGVNTHMYYATSSTDVNGLREFAYVPSGSPTTPDMNILSASFASTIAGITTTAGYTTTASFNAYTQSANQRIGSLEAATSSYVTSTITASSLVTASVAGNVLTFTKGDATTFTLTVATGSGGGGGAAFPYTGSAEITGSLGITGSFRGFVNALSVASSTASIDMVNGNFFTLNLPTSSTTHIAITNIKSGQTINLQVSQSSANTGSIAFAPNIKFAGGFDYTATAITGALDLVSFVAFDANQILATSVKNLL